jgi:lipid II:glycine glycyltransferase (peptidoglycan interpeptide bridge formation enzyme)
MEFIEVQDKDRAEWNTFILEHSPESFLQSWEWGAFQEKAGRKVRRWRMGEKGRTRAQVQVIEHSLPFGMKYWYVPRGPVLEETADKLPVLESLLRQLEEEAKAAGALFLRLDPAFPSAEAGLLEKGGLRPLPGSVQPKDTLVLDLHKSEEELLGEMKQKTRYNLRLAEKKGVTVTSGAYTPENFEKFWQLTEETAARDGIVSHAVEYYRQMLETLSGEGGLECRLYTAAFEEEILAANYVLFFGPYAVYLHGASGNSHRNLMAPYLLQWQQIRDAKARGCTAYDFWGITRENANPKWAGITRFKQGFGGKERSYAGVFDLPLHPLLYALYARLRRVG